MASPNHEDVESVDPSFMMFDQVVGCIEDVLISKYVFAESACGAIGLMSAKSILLHDLFVLAEH